MHNVILRELPWWVFVRASCNMRQYHCYFTQLDVLVKLYKQAAIIRVTLSMCVLSVVDHVNRWPFSCKCEFRVHHGE